MIKNAAPAGGITTKRELAMFLAQILVESAGLKYKSETRCATNGCPGDYETAQDFPGARYYGRGYMQLSWSYNYRPASSDLYKDLRLYENPNLVSASDEISWAVSFWYWKVRVRIYTGVISGQFGVSTKAINGGLECPPGPNVSKAKIRFDIYKRVLIAFNINETANEIGCY